jgi:hypothetical protein
MDAQARFIQRVNGVVLTVIRALGLQAGPCLAEIAAKLTAESARYESLLGKAIGKAEVSRIHTAQSAILAAGSIAMAAQSMVLHLRGQSVMDAVIGAASLNAESRAASKAIERIDVLVSALQRKAVGGAHKENREMKAEAIDWYRAHRAEFKNKDDAAEYMTRLWKVSFATIRRNWINGI